jgi:hypothetical protein
MEVARRYIHRQVVRADAANLGLISYAQVRHKEFSLPPALTVLTLTPHMGVVPYGYRADEHGRLEIAPEEADTVRDIIANVAAGSTLYAEAQRLTNLGVPTPGWRYGSRARKPGARAWYVATVSNIDRQRAYSGTHDVRVNGGEELIEQAVPAVVDATLQERAKVALK